MKTQRFFMVMMLLVGMLFILSSCKTGWDCGCTKTQAEYMRHKTR